jgi:hypothetical protein
LNLFFKKIVATDVLSPLHSLLAARGGRARTP